MKLFVADADAYLYPDVMVTCDERDRRAELAIEHPRLVVEVLSDSTAAYDRGIKFAAYRKLADLREYLLVDVDQRRLELCRRAAGHWILLESERAGRAGAAPGERGHDAFTGRGVRGPGRGGSTGAVTWCARRRCAPCRSAGRRESGVRAPSGAAVAEPLHSQLPQLLQEVRDAWRFL